MHKHNIEILNVYLNYSMRKTDFYAHQSNYFHKPTLQGKAIKIKAIILQKLKRLSTYM